MCEHVSTILRVLCDFAVCIVKTVNFLIYDILDRDGRVLNIQLT